MLVDQGKSGVSLVIVGRSSVVRCDMDVTRAATSGSATSGRYRWTAGADPRPVARVKHGFGRRWLVSSGMTMSQHTLGVMCELVRACSAPA